MGAVPSADCERARRRSSLALDGELSEVGHAALRAHLARCSACAAFARGAESLTLQLRAAPLVRPRVAPGPRRRRRVRALHGAVAAAAVLAAAGLGTAAGTLSTREHGPTPTTPSPGKIARVLASAAGHGLPNNQKRPIAL